MPNIFQAVKTEVYNPPLCWSDNIVAHKQGGKNGANKVLPELRLGRKRVVRVLSTRAKAVRRILHRVHDEAHQKEAEEDIPSPGYGLQRNFVDVSDRDDLAASHHQQPLVGEVFFHRPGHGYVLAARLPFVLHKVGDRWHEVVGEVCDEESQPLIQLGLLLVIQLDAGFRGSRPFPNHFLESSQRCKWRELRRPVVHRHLRMVPRDVMRQVDDVIVWCFHFITLQSNVFTGYAVAVRFYI